MGQIAFAASVCGSFAQEGAPGAQGGMEESKAEAFADLASLAGESFNLGLRFYWSMAACCWLLSPWLCIACSGALAFGLWRREFRAPTLMALQKAYPPAATLGATATAPALGLPSPAGGGQAQGGDAARAAKAWL